MPDERPTLDALQDRVIGDISSRNEGRAYLKRAAEKIWGFVIGGVAHGVYGYLQWTREQQYPTSCEVEGLRRWGVPLELPQKGGARAAGGAAYLTGTPGRVIDEGTQWRALNDALVLTRQTVTLAADPVLVELIAKEPGPDGNLPALAPLSLVIGIDGLDNDTQVEVPLTGGLLLEDTERYRDRILDGLRRKTRNGGPGDYRAWALEVEGVTRAWEYSHRMGVGTVSLAFLYDDRADPFPSPVEVAAMQAYLDARKPADARAVYVGVSIAMPVNITMLLSPSTPEVEAAVRAELAKLFDEVEHEQALDLSVVDEAISSAPGETSHTLLTISSLNPGPWGLLTLGTVNFGV